MNVNNKIIQAKINKRNNVVNYFNNIENHHFNNSSLHSESMTNDKSAYSINSSSIFEKKKKLNSIKHKKPNKISFLKPEFSSFRNYFFHKSTQHQKNKNTFLNLSANLEENKNIINKIRIPKKVMIKKPILNFPKISNNIINRHILKRLKSKKPFHNLGENFIERNKYFTDFVRIDSTNKSKQLLDKKNWENGEKKSEKVQKDENNMKDNDINIEKLATKLNLFQNYNHCRNANLSKNNSFLSTIIFNENKKINNIKIEKENSNLLLEINKKNSLNHSFSNISKISSGTPNTRIYSGNLINNFNNVNINLLNFDKNKMNNILYQKEFSNISYKEYKYNKEGMSVMSPFNSQDKDNILYKQIFFHFDHQKISEILSKSINNKFNILYAENEKQFDSKAMIRNKLNKKKGKRKIILIGKSENVKKAESINHKINFIKKIFDYAYPDIFIRKMKHETNYNKDINLKKNRKLIENLKKKILEKKNMLSNSVLIEKL